MGKKVRAFFKSGLTDIGHSLSIIANLGDVECESNYKPTDWDEVFKDRPKTIEAAFRRDAKNIGKDMYKVLGRINGQKE